MATMDMNSTDTMVMQMYFYASAKATILFQQWQVDTWQGMLLSCVVLFVVAIGYETLKYCRHRLVQAKIPQYDEKTSSDSYDMAKSDVTKSDVTLTKYDTIVINIGEDKTDKRSSCGVYSNVWVWVDGLLYTCEILLSYCLMLVFMAYNVYLCLAVVLGAATGYIILQKSRYQPEHNHCH